ncbi:hypothetical protein RH915_08045 [Serpentinicella sp. ANB-PHB4]|uniref:hypothetical protein n=1 Tax=Serpentinicella sp. ANB-PHB4 TaxID=3074076 RepID=UPI00285AFB43|nr:hypothetical protein [Serpentinicella sp. ANB-PHB4]MDR5659440.1 hypothetical protein [Serpentinicella sp. ANB-PHB4]
MIKHVFKWLFMLLFAFMFSGFFENIDELGYAVITLQLVSGAAVGYIIFTSFSGIFAFKGYTETKETKSRGNKLVYVNLIWGISFLLANILEGGRIVRILNILAVAVIIISIIELIKIKKNTDQEQEKMTTQGTIKLGYMLILYYISLPVILILLLKGY